MGPEAILLSVREPGSEGTYSFDCPLCTDSVEKQADRKIVALLVSAGVSVAQEPAEEIPAALPAEDRPSGPALTMDDLIRFHFLLEDDHYLERFLADR
jgi:hypothetical protein